LTQEYEKPSLDLMEGTRNQPAGSAARIPGTDAAAFTLTRGADAPIPIIIAVPHAGRDYPSSVTAGMRDPMQAALRLEDRYVDQIAEAIAQMTGAALLVAHAPRAMLDLNRAPEDVDWSMVIGGAPEGISGGGRHSLANRRARGGLGIVPRRLAGSGEIWKQRIERRELETRVEAIHRPYHAALSTALENLRDRWGAALLLDLHSMPPLPERRAGQAPAEFVIGDRFGASCHRTLASLACDYFAGHDRPVAHNRPYAGGYVLDRHAAPARGIHAIQLEICRSSYLDARLAEPSGRAGGVARLVAGLVRALAGEVLALGESGRQPLAAE
jgi:N-formylglutamate amidohydrolase